ncbi:hypothetical protein [Hyphomonas sp.]|uniref:hypothetical protein n=1 Tax=Hyphomonas sp. TaxID=87 RepID=UPI00391BCDCD
MSVTSGFRVSLLLPRSARPYTESYFADRPQVVRIGIDLSNDIVLPQALAGDFNEGVRQFHCTLIYTGSNFRIDFEGGAEVFVAGEAQSIITLTNPFELSSGSKVSLRLGTPKATPESVNPEIIIERLGKASAVPPGKRGARTGRPSNDIVAVVRQTRRRQTRQGAFVSVMVLLMCAFALAGLKFFERLERFPGDRLRELEASVAVIGTALGGPVALSQDDIADTFVPVGTGWLCCGPDTDRSGDVLKIVTNAHVVSQVDSMARAGETDQRILAVFPRVQNGGSETEPVIVDLTRAIRQDRLFAEHRLYARFQQQFQSSSRPYSNVYDVAHIEIADEETRDRLRHHARFEIGAGLSSADRQVGIIGYPVENLPRALNPLDPVARTYIENVARRTDPFLSPSAGQEALVPELYAVRAESAGGLSGSPLIQFNRTARKFEVVGMVFSASFLQSDPRTDASSPRVAASDIVFASGALAIRQHLALVPAGFEEAAENSWRLLGNPRRNISAACDAFFAAAVQSHPSLEKEGFCAALGRNFSSATASEVAGAVPAGMAGPAPLHAAMRGCTRYGPGQVVSVVALSDGQRRYEPLTLDTWVVSERVDPGGTCDGSFLFDVDRKYMTDSNASLVQVVKPGSDRGGIIWYELTAPAELSFTLAIGCFPETAECGIRP